MNELQMGLLLGYLFLAILLLLALISGRLYWWAKAGLIVLAVGFYWLSYQGWKQSQGWPSETAMPDRFLFHYAVIEEPDKVLGLEGAIFLWLTDLHNDELAAEPRAFRLPYTQETHAKVASAMQTVQDGQLLLGYRPGGEELPQVRALRKELGDIRMDFELEPVPDPSLPEK